MAARPAHPHSFWLPILLRSRRRVPISSFPVCAVLDGHRSTVGPVRRSRDMAARVQGDVTGIVRPRARYRTGPHASRRARPSPPGRQARSEEHTSELQSLMRISYAVFCLKKKKTKTTYPNSTYKNKRTTYRNQ